MSTCIEVLLAQGLKHYQENEMEQALRCFQRILSTQPQHVPALVNIGVIYIKEGNYAKAIKHLTAVWLLQPNDVQVNLCLAEAHALAGYSHTAIGQLHHLLQSNPHVDKAWLRLVNLLYPNDMSGQKQYLENHLTRLPGTLTMCDYLANLYYETKDYRQAIVYFQKYIAIVPNSAKQHFGLAWCYLFLGDFLKGFYEYEWRTRLFHDDFIRYEQLPRWDGLGKVGENLLVVTEQGLGDNMMFARYLPLLKGLGCSVTLLCPGPLMRLFAHSFTDHQLALVETGELPPCDCFIPIGSLPHIFGSTIDTIPNHVPYVHVPPALLDDWKSRMESTAIQHPITDDSMKIGFVWAGKSTRRNRSCQLGEFLPLLQLKGIHWYSLQVGEATTELNQLLTTNPTLPIANLTTQIEDFADTAGMIANLDMVITIDTSVAHLAGALGKPTWLLLPSHNEWRWLLERSDSPWYPTMKIFRQEHEGDWSVVFQAVKQELQRLL